MQIDNRQQAYTSRGTRESGHTGLGRRFALEGDARPGDVLVLAGGALVRDLNANGLVDGPDEQLDDGAPALLGGLVDVRDEQLDDGAPALLGGLVDVRG